MRGRWVVASARYLIRYGLLSGPCGISSRASSGTTGSLNPYTRSTPWCLHLHRLAAVHGQEFDQLVAADPNFVVSVLLGLVEDQLQTEVQVGFVDVVGVLRAAVSGASQVADHVAGLHVAPLL